MSDALNLLTSDLSGVDTSMPLLAEGLYDLTIASAEECETRDKSGSLLTLVLKTTRDEKSVKGDLISSGYPVYHRISLTPTEKRGVEMIRRDLAMFGKAVGVNTIAPLENLIGKIVRCKVIVEPESTDPKTGRTYDAGNRIKTFVPA